MAITAMTPACSGSETTRSAASRTLPTMLRAMTLQPLTLDLAHRLGNLAAHDRARQHQNLRAWQAGHGPHRVGQRLLPHQRNRIHRDALAADVVTIGLADGADGDLPHLRAAADDDDALAVDGQQRGLERDALDQRQRR